MVISIRDLEELSERDLGIFIRVQKGIDQDIQDHNSFQEYPLKCDKSWVHMTPEVAERLRDNYIEKGWKVELERDVDYMGKDRGGYSFTFSK